MVAHYENLRVMIQQQNNGEKWQTTRQKTNLENFVLRERLADKMVDNIMFIRQANVHYMVPMFEQLG